VAGYISWKSARGRDCCCGASTLCCPSLRFFGRCARRKNVGVAADDDSLTVIEFFHQAVMRCMLGLHFYGDVRDDLDETKGKSYSELVREIQGSVWAQPFTYTSIILMRKIPYENKYRAQVFGQPASVEPDNPHWTGYQMSTWRAAHENSIPPVEKFLKAVSSGDDRYIDSALSSASGLATVKRDDGATAAHIAASSGHATVLDLILKAGADANETDGNGRNILHLSILSDSMATVRVALLWGADASARDKDGRTPRDVVKNDSPILSLFPGGIYAESEGTNAAALWT
jgi:hypothetical protein